MSYSMPLNSQQLKHGFGESDEQAQVADVNMAKAASQGAMPLSLVRTDGVMSVIKVKGKSEARSFLNNLGFVEGSEVTVVCENGGNLIVNVKGTRVALSREMACNVMVK